jgi:hypothetical protein
MKNLNFLRSILVILILLSLPLQARSQSKWRPYLNAGYITNFEKCSDCTTADTGGSIRIGMLNKGLSSKGRLGFYAGYTWFKEHHEDYVGYDDKGWLIMAGIDFRLLTTGNLDWYLKLGIGSEKFISTYPNSYTDSETNIKPDIGLLFNWKHFNLYAGWQPSEPAHINLGIGFTFYKASERPESSY